jgi:hypothetical protein
MYDKGKTLGGLAIFVCLVTFPAWYVAASGKADYTPNPVLPAGETRCVESTQYMREYHTQLLQNWRDLSVRQGISSYKSSDNRTYEIKLTGTCLQCHSNKTEFCDRCHTYSGVSPNCWDCHIIPPNIANQGAK